MDPYSRTIYYGILIAAAAIGGVLIYFILKILRQQRRHLRQQRENLLQEIDTLENERRRIVTDLHDELGPLLSVVKIHVMNLESAPAANASLIGQANAGLDHILEKIRDICNELMPPALIRKGLIMAITEFVADCEKRSPIEIQFRYHDEKIGGKTEIHLYRIVQEAVNNAIRHSAAKNIDIEILQDDKKLVMGIRDDGTGFNIDKVLRLNKGVGIKNILSRVEILKGDLYIASNPQKGTTYTIEIPNT